MNSSNKNLLDELNPEQRAKLQQKIEEKIAAGAAVAASGVKRTAATGGGGWESGAKRVKVRIRPTDNMGAAALPEGYADLKKKTSAWEAKQGVQAAQAAALSFQEKSRIAEESRASTSGAAGSKLVQPKKILRVGGGKIWEDPTLLHWDNDDYRLFAGDLGNEVTDDLLTKSFSQYPSLIKAHVVREKRTNKSKGYGFISFKDPDDYVKAMREMNGKYVGNRPITLKRSTVKESMATKESIKQQKELASLKVASK